MSEENEVKNVEAVESEKITPTEPAPAATPETPAENTTTAPPKAKLETFTPPVLMLLFAVVALFLILIFLMNGNKGNPSGRIAMDDPSVEALRADIEARRSELNRQRIENGLPPLQGGAESMDEIAARLKKDVDMLTSLSGSFQQLLTEKDAQLNEAGDEIMRSQQARNSLSNELSQLRQEYQKALIDSSEVSSLRMQLEAVLSQRQTMSDELLAARQQLTDSAGSVTQAQYADLEQRYREAASARDFFENRVKELEAQIGKTDLFAESEEELLPAAVELFRRLRTLEGMKDSDLTTEYSRLGVDLGANVLHTLSFATGSSDLNEEDQQRIQSVIEEIPDGDLALIIGYASVTGDSQTNQTLSSDRATSAAEFYAGMKRNGQMVQAVYLGQTDRFSSRIPERNQICEIWRIRRK